MGDIDLDKKEFTSIVKKFSGGGAYIPAYRLFVDKRVKVTVLPDELKT